MTHKWTVLLVEDNLADILLVRDSIGMAGLDVDLHEARDGEQAIQFIESSEQNQSAPVPDLVVLDLNLPRVNGFEVLQRARASEKFKKIPVLVVTSSDSLRDRREAAALGASYFRKPPEYLEFLKLGAVLRELLAPDGAS